MKKITFLMALCFAMFKTNAQEFKFKNDFTYAPGISFSKSTFSYKNSLHYTRHVGNHFAGYLLFEHGQTFIKNFDNQKTTLSGTGVGIGVMYFKNESRNGLYGRLGLEESFTNYYNDPDLIHSETKIRTGLGYRYALNERFFIDSEFIGSYNYKNKNFSTGARFGIGIKF